jgi:4-hydroxy-tetrahydrodipicolinate synthase
MDRNGQIDYHSLTKLVEFQIENKVTGLVVMGTTGESTALTSEEKIAVIKHVININQGRVKIIIGVSAVSTQSGLDCFKLLEGISGIDYLMCVTPYYVKPTQEGLYLHFATLAKATELPIILYNVPGRTATDLSDATTLRLAVDFPNIVGLKDATGNIKRCGYLVRNRPAGFFLLSGDDGTLLQFLLTGGDGVISVASNNCPAEISALCESALAGDFKKAQQISQKLDHLCDVLFCEANPIPVKWALFYQQVIGSPQLRLPLTELTPQNQLKVKAALEAV